MYKQQMNENITQGHARKLNKNKKAITISIKLHTTLQSHKRQQAKFKNTSLNEHLIPSLYSLFSSLSVLLKF